MERKNNVEQETNKLHIEYERPFSNNRLYSSVVDFFIAIIVILLLVFGANGIVKTTDFYKEKFNVINETKLASKVYDYDANNNVVELSNLLLIQDDTTASILVNRATYAIEGDSSPNAPEKQQTGYLFFAMVEELKNPAELKDFYKNAVEDYEKTRINIINPRNGKNLFEYSKDENGNIKKIPGITVYRTTVDGNVKYTKDPINETSEKFQGEDRNLVVRTSYGKAEDFIDYYYKNYIKILSKDIVKIPSYYNATKAMSDLMLTTLIPVPVALGLIITYFVPGIIFRRGRKSIGKLMFKIGILDKTNFSPKFWRHALRSLIIVAECALFVAAVIDVTMIIFSKTGTSLHDKILKMNLVSTKNTKVYLDGYDALIGSQKVDSKPVDFKHIDDLH